LAELLLHEESAGLARLRSRDGLAAPAPYAIAWRARDRPLPLPLPIPVLRRHRTWSAFIRIASLRRYHGRPRTRGTTPVLWICSGCPSAPEATPPLSIPELARPLEPESEPPSEADRIPRTTLPRLPEVPGTSPSRPDFPGADLRTAGLVQGALPPLPQAAVQLEPDRVEEIAQCVSCAIIFSEGREREAHPVLALWAGVRHLRRDSVLHAPEHVRVGLRAVPALVRPWSGAERPIDHPVSTSLRPARTAVPIDRPIAHPARPCSSESLTAAGRPRPEVVHAGASTGSGQCPARLPADVPVPRASESRPAPAALQMQAQNALPGAHAPPDFAGAQQPPARAQFLRGRLRWPRKSASGEDSPGECVP
jgi:hypothetical protein